MKANGRLYRPLTLFSFKVTRTLFGPSPGPQHALNVLIHGLNATLAFFLLRRILPQFYPAVMGSLLFAVHPVHVEAVGPVVGRSELLAFLFGMTAILFHFRDRNRWVTLPASLLAFLSKEHALALVPVLLLYDLFQGKAYLRSRRGILLGLIGCVGIFLAIRFAVFSHLGSQPDFPSFQLRETDNPLLLLGWSRRLIAAVAILGKYLRLLVWPGVLCCDYTQLALALEASWLSLDFFSGCVLHGFLAVVLFVFARRKSSMLLGPLLYLGFLFTIWSEPEPRSQRGRRSCISILDNSFL